MAEFNQMKTLQLWYRALTAEELMAGLPPDLRKRLIKRIEKEQAKSRARSSSEARRPQGEMPVIKDQLPTIFHAEGHTPGQVQQAIKDAFAGYRNTLATSYQSLLDPLRDQGRRDQGRGRRQRRDLCWVLLLMAAKAIPSFSRSRKRAVGPGAVRRRERLPEPRPARRERLPPHAAREATCSSGEPGAEARLLSSSAS